MDLKTISGITEILKEELVPAMGCTEPIAIAYASSIARSLLSSLPTSVTVYASPNIIKNVKSVVVPHTGGERGIEAAASIGERWAVLLRNHGPVACGRDIDEAVLCARVVEKACELFLAGKASGLPLCPMPEDKVLSECDRYRNHYGQDKK